MQYEQISFDELLYEDFKIIKPIRLITTFSGYDSQKLALNYLGVKNVEHYRTCEWAVKSIQALYDLHFSDDKNDYSKDLSKEDIINYLFNIGISANYNEPMNRKQIEKLGEEKARNIYNQIKAEHNLVNIMQVKGKDLEIVDTDKYEYLLTYSFPCQDLSLAGKRKGMSLSQADGGTRSGLLWEIERILNECDENNSLPQILMMENVPEVIGNKNIKDFQKWELKLESLGYRNYIEILNAKDFGIPQNRRRCFMISILGDYNYKFPKKMKLEYCLKDLLEDNVDEKYYLSDKQINSSLIWKAQQNPYESLGKEISPTLTTRTGAFAAGMILITNYSIEAEKKLKKSLLKYQNENKENGNETFIAVKEDNLKRELCNELIRENKVEEGDIVKHSYTTQIMNGNKKCVEKSNECITLTTRGDCIGVVVKDNEPKVINPLKDRTSYGWHFEQEIYDENGITRAVKAGGGSGNIPKVIKSNLRIRKLTPRECGRLMGVKDEDISKLSINQSNASLYHLFGDSIVTTVMMAIFGKLFDINYEEKIRNFIEENIIKGKEQK